MSTSALRHFLGQSHGAFTEVTQLVEAKRFVSHFISFVGNYEPPCIVTIKMETM